MDDIGLIHHTGGLCVIEQKDLVQSLLVDRLVPLGNHSDQLLVHQLIFLHPQDLAETQTHGVDDQLVRSIFIYFILL